jgi:hypothetical protein
MRVCCTPPTGTIGRSLQRHRPARRSRSTCWVRWPCGGPPRGSTSSSVRGDVYDRAVPSADAHGRAQPGGGPAAAGRGDGRADPRQPRLRPAVGHLLGTARGRRPARARRDPRLDEPVLLPTSTATSRSTGCPTWSPRSPVSSWVWAVGTAARLAATRPCWARRWTGCAPTCTCGPASDRWSWRTPSSAAGSPARASADISVGGVDLVPGQCSTGSTTSRWAICTAHRR